MSETKLFASASLTEHLLRGVAGICMLVFALSIAETQPLGAIVLGVGTLVAFKGCPACWTIGLFETIALRISRIRAKGATEQAPKQIPAQQKPMANPE